MHPATSTNTDSCCPADSGPYFYSDAHSPSNSHAYSYSYLYAHADSHAEPYTYASYFNASPSHPNACDLF